MNIEVKKVKNSFGVYNYHLVIIGLSNFCNLKDGSVTTLGLSRDYQVSNIIRYLKSKFPNEPILVTYVHNIIEDDSL